MIVGDAPTASVAIAVTVAAIAAPIAVTVTPVMTVPMAPAARTHLLDGTPGGRRDFQRAKGTSRRSGVRGRGRESHGKTKRNNWKKVRRVPCPP